MKQLNYLLVVLAATLYLGCTPPERVDNGGNNSDDIENNGGSENNDGGGGNDGNGNNGGAENTSKPTTSAPYEVGDYYNESGKEGIVIEVDQDGNNGKIISLRQSSSPLQWASDVAEQNRLVGTIYMSGGVENLAKIVKIPNWKEKYPAFKWCFDYGKGWYLPALQEVERFILFPAIREAINKGLKENGGTPITTLAYWSSTELQDNELYGAFRAYYVNAATSKSLTNDKKYKFYVRAVASFGDWYDAIVPTCTTDGRKERECSACHTKEASVTTALGHTAGTPVEENTVPPTCTDNGSYDNVVYCTVCNAELSRNTETVSALGHTAGEAKVENNVAPDCVNDGSYDNVTYCIVCNVETYRKTEVVAALGHRAGETTVEKRTEPDCVNDGGYDNVVYCSVCDGEISRETVTTPTKGHVEDTSAEYTFPTCTTEGRYVFVAYCPICQLETYRNEEIYPALNHAETVETQENVIAADCTNGGSYESVVNCAYCKLEMSRSVVEVPALGHDFNTEWTVDIAPTCTTAGIKTHHCLLCDKMGDITVIEALGHTFGEWCETKAPTFDTTGEEKRTCEKCTYSETRDTEALGYLGGFIDAVTKLSENESAEVTYGELYFAIQLYAGLTDEEKAQVSEYYDTLKTAVDNYNAEAHTANNELATATEIAFAPITISFAFLAVLWFLLKKKFFI